MVVPIRELANTLFPTTVNLLNNNYSNLQPKQSSMDFKFNIPQEYAMLPNFNNAIKLSVNSSEFFTNYIEYM